ncbi:MAG: hypothetical protein LBV69_05655 [Bacteroidales bacterium]|nr:hypothetical protein [Bacteroidales bacterium]
MSVIFINVLKKEVAIIADDVKNIKIDVSIEMGTIENNVLIHISNIGIIQTNILKQSRYNKIVRIGKDTLSTKKTGIKITLYINSKTLTVGNFSLK